MISPLIDQSYWLVVAHTLTFTVDVANAVTNTDSYIQQIKSNISIHLGLNPNLNQSWEIVLCGFANTRHTFNA